MNALLYRVWTALGIDMLDRCHVAQPASAEMLAAAGPRLTAAGLHLSQIEIVELIAELLTADEPPQPLALTDRSILATSPPIVPTAASALRARVCDADCREAITARPNLIVPWLLMAGYAYHQLAAPILTDGCWDELCRLAQALWDRIEHRHKHLIGPDDLAAGSLFALTEDAYPEISRSAAIRILRDGVWRMVVSPLPMPPSPPPPDPPSRPLSPKPSRRSGRSAPVAGEQLSLF